MEAVSVKNICKHFGATEALSSVSIEVQKGQIYGIIGADGAGKSTLFDILATLLKADSGEAFILGQNVNSEYKSIRSFIGYMPGRFSLYQDLTVNENLEFFASIFGTTIDAGYNLIKDIWCQLEPFKGRMAGKLSGGMKQKLALCCALIHQPKVLFLDEPTGGVDPVSRRELWQMLKALQGRGLTVLVSTPYMDEAVLCDRVAFLHAGAVLAVNTPKAMIEAYLPLLFEVSCPNNSAYSMIVALREFELTHSCYAFGQVVHWACKDASSGNKYIAGRLASYLLSVGLLGAVIKPTTPTIEDCFMELTSSKIEM